MKGNALTISTPTERHHVLANMKGNLIPNSRRTILQEELNEIVAIDVGTDIDQGHTWTTRFLFRDLGDVGLEEFVATSFQCLFNDFGGELVGAVGCCVIEDDFKGTETVFWMAVFDNVLDDPISPLTTSNGVDIFKNLLNTRSLPISILGGRRLGTLSSSKQFSKTF
jgi:hypothetical protein